MKDNDPRNLGDMLREMGFEPAPAKAAWKDELETARKAFEKLAADNGLTIQQFWSELAVGILVSWNLARAARRGNVAKTVRWSAAALQQGQKYWGRRHEVQLKKIAKLVDINEV